MVRNRLANGCERIKALFHITAMKFSFVRVMPKTVLIRSEVFAIGHFHEM
jgi:hypothetical protein